MNNRKFWIAIKAGLIGLLLVYFFTDPVKDTFRLMIRIGMLAVFTFSLVRDITDLKKNT
jgi:hypothetical protein